MALLLAACGVAGAAPSALGAQNQLRPANLPWRQEREQVAVSAEMLDAEACEEVFGVNFIARNIQPVLLKIANDGNSTYTFSKASVDAQYLPAGTVAKYAYPNLVVSGAKWTGHLVTFVPRTLFRRGKTPARPLTRGDVRHDFSAEEIADGPIGPKTRREGFLFLHARPEGLSLKVALTNAQTNTPLTFDLGAGPTRAGAHDE
ncbi:MAG: hypothetical protein HY737_07330 [Candidatus Omnitrophica bacterium]|nr:hypothetical protein [Candidatus Omnitrophota bacterium]